MVGFIFGWWDVAYLTVQAAEVVPVDPLRADQVVHFGAIRPESAGSGEVRRLIWRQVHCWFEKIGVPTP